MRFCVPAAGGLIRLAANCGNGAGVSATSGEHSMAIHAAARMTIRMTGLLCLVILPDNATRRPPVIAVRRTKGASHCRKITPHRPSFRHSGLV